MYQVGRRVKVCMYQISKQHQAELPQSQYVLTNKITCLQINAKLFTNKYKLFEIEKNQDHKQFKALTNRNLKLHNSNSFLKDTL